MAKGYKTGGRKKGSVNKTPNELRAMVLTALDKSGGVKYLAEQAQKNPTAFLALVGKCIGITGQGPNGEHVFRIESPWLNQVLAQRGLG